MAHNSKLFDELNEQTVAYLFLINMRMMFNYQDDELQYYEKILLQLFKKDNEQVLVELNTEDLLSKVSDAYLELRNSILDEYQNGNRIDDNTLHFNELANNIQLSNSPLRDNKELFIKILYQMFWLITSNPIIDRRGNFLEIKFHPFN